VAAVEATVFVSVVVTNEAIEVAMIAVCDMEEKRISRVKVARQKVMSREHPTLKRMILRQGVVYCYLEGWEYITRKG